MVDVTNALLVKVFFPLCIIPCIYIRQNGFSLVYLLFFFLMPCLKASPTPKDIKKGFTGVFLKIALALNGLFFIGHLISQIIFIIMAEKHLFQNCDIVERLIRHIGIISWQELPVGYILQDILPEFLMLLILMATYIRCARVAKAQQTKKRNIKNEAKKLFLMIAIGKGGLAVMLGLVAALSPSFLGLFYLAMSLLVFTIWACRRRMWRRILSWPMLMLLVGLVAAHTLAVFLLQTQIVQENFPHSYLSYFDLTIITDINCDDPRRVGYKPVKWEAYALPILLLLLYWLAATVLCLMKYAKTARRRLEEKGESLSGRGTAADLNWTRALVDFVRTLRYMKYLDEAVSIVSCAFMMLWAVLYPGFLPLVLLLWAASLCLFPGMKKRALGSSPLLVTYACCLLLAQYLYAIEQLSPHFSKVYTRQLGIVFGTNGESYLFGEIIFVMVFFVLLHQYMMRRELKRKGRELEKMPSEQNKVASAHEVPATAFLLFLQTFRSYLVITWIVVFTTVIVVVLCTGHIVTLFRILYLLLFILFVTIFEFSYDGWRRMLPAYCLTVGFFTLFIVLVEYMDRIYNNDEIWRILNLDDDTLRMMGAREFGNRLLTMLKYIGVLIATMVQIQFNEDFLLVTDIRRKLSVQDEYQDRRPSLKKKYLSKVKKIEMWIEKTCIVAAKFLESHAYKVLFFYLVLLAINHISVIHLGVVLLSTAYLLGRHAIRAIFAKICLLIVCLHSIQWMVFHIYKHNPYTDETTNCSMLVTTDFKDGTVEEVVISSYHMYWAGIHHPSAYQAEVILLFHVGYLILALCFAACSRYIQFKSFSKGEYRRYTYMIFPKLTRDEADYNVQNCMKYLTNYFFYKFGVEICFISMMIMIGLRKDGIAVMYLLWIFCLFALQRHVLAKVWIFLVCFSLISIVFQYLSLLRPPPDYCIDYPWFMDRNWRLAQDWLFLPGPVYPPLKEYLIYEVVAFIFICRQRVVFAIEKKHGPLYPGGSNETIDDEVEDRLFVNPVPDYVTFTRSWLDIWKKIFFLCIFWLTLIVVFLAGSTEVNFFSLGYLIGSFSLFWKGEDFFLYSAKVIRHQWNMLIAFNLSVILSKLLLQFLSNLLLLYSEAHTCFILRLFTIERVARPGGPADETHTVEERCVLLDKTSLALDITCFVFIILARRAFTSYYFVHIINEYKATSIMSSKGAALYDRLRYKEIAMREDQEQEVLEKIAKKMEDLRAKQKKVHENPFFVSPQSHYEAVLSGDYFFFDEKEIHEDDRKRQEREDMEDRERNLESRKLRPNLTSSDSDEKLLGDTTLKRRMSVTELLTQTKRYKMEKAAIKARERRASGSIDEEREGEGENEENRAEENTPEKDKSKDKKPSACTVLFRWILELLDAAIMSFALKLYNLTKNYRFVVQELVIQKKKILATGALQGVRDTPKSPWRPSPQTRDYLTESDESSEENLVMRSSSVSFQVQMQSAAERAEFRFMKKSHQKSSFFTLMLSVTYLVLANTELICYLLIVLHQLIEPTMVSLLMTFAMFLIGVLSVPRPSMTFWVCLMAYTQVVVVVKCLFNFMHRTPDREESKYEVTVNTMALIGLEQNVQGSLLDLFLIVFILVHRYRLKKFGLWGKPTSVFSYDSTYQISGYELSHTSRNPIGMSSPSSKTRSFVHTKEEREKFYSYYPATLVLLISKYRLRVKKFYTQILVNITGSKTDVYTWMFFMEGACFILILAFVDHFSEMQRDWIWYFKKNRVPLSIFVILFGQFMMMVIDRIIYVRKSVVAKLVYYYIQVIIVHCILFFFLPITIQRKVNKSPVLQIFYFIKCVYFLLCAYQIRSGYAVFAHGYLFRHKYNIAAWFFHIGYMSIPFFVELRNIIDWSSSDSNLTLSEWFKLEDIYNNIYDVKCQRENEKVWVKLRGKGNSASIMIVLGGGLLLIVILLLWFPLIIFMIKHNLGKPNPPDFVKLELTIDSYPTLFRGTSYFGRIFTYDEWKEFKSLYKHDIRALETIGYFKADDTSVLKVATTSLKWDDSQPLRNYLIDDLQNKETMTLILTWTIGYQGGVDIVGDNRIETTLGDDIRTGLTSALGGGSFFIPYLFPKFLDTTRVSMNKDRGETSALEGFLTEDSEAFRGVTLSYDDGTDSWAMTEECSGTDWDTHLKRLPEAGCDSLVVYIFSEKKFGFWLDDVSTLSAQSIYLLILFTLCALIRRMWRNTLYRLHVLEMPYPDRILELCHDIYIVRLAKCFDLEEDLFAKLYFLFRSPETLIMFTRRPKDMKREVPEGVPHDYLEEEAAAT